MISKPDQEPQDDQLDIDLDLLGILRRRYALIATGVLIGGILAALFYFQQTPIYESELVVLVGQRSSELASTGKGSVEGASSIQEEILSTHMELLGSHKIVGDAIRNDGLGMSVIDIQENLSITKGGEGLAKNASVLKATYQDPNPERAAQILQSVFDSYQNYIESQSRNVGEEAAELIAKALQANEQELRKSDQEYRDFIQSMPALVSTRNGNEELRDVHSIRLSKLEEELAAIRQSLAESRARHAVIKNQASGRKPEDLTESDVMALLSEKEIARIMAFVSITNGETNEQQLSKLKSQESTRLEYARLIELMSKERVARASLGEAHPSIGAMRAEIANMQEYIDASKAGARENGAHSEPPSPSQMINGYFKVLTNDVAALEIRESELLALAETETKLAKEVELSFALGNSLKFNLQRAQTRYDEVFKRLQEINLTSDYAGFSTDLLAMPLPSLSTCLADQNQNWRSWSAGWWSAGTRTGAARRIDRSHLPLSRRCRTSRRGQHSGAHPAYGTQAARQAGERGIAGSSYHHRLPRPASVRSGDVSHLADFRALPGQERTQTRLHDHQPQSGRRQIDHDRQPGRIAGPDRQTHSADRRRHAASDPGQDLWHRTPTWFVRFFGRHLVHGRLLP